MDNSTYLKESESTECKFPDGKNLEPFEIIALINAGSAAINACNALDEVKRVIIYGKMPEYLENEEDSLQAANENYVAMMRESGKTEEEIAARLKLDQEQIELIHHAIGLVTEAGEILEPVLRFALDEDALDKVNLAEELGDSNWYQAGLHRLLGTTFEEVNAKNIAKLKDRYPDKFDAGAAVNRDLGKERATLEQDHR
jgi:NTP pyrophosphatase (non-canonical NTP hydrolase)